MIRIPHDIEQRLARLDAELDELRRDHPDDFWAAWERKTHPIIDDTPAEARTLLMKRLDELLIARQLGPADPGS